MSRFASLVSAILISASVTTSALAERRVALVIGNSNYQNSARLANPESDASAIGLLLKNARFDVVEVHQNMSGADMRRSIRNFSETTKDADIALVFYAGHGIEVGGTNYLIPIDAALRKDIDVEDEAVSLDRVLTLLEPAKKLRLVILDACRDNPYASRMSRTLASRSVGRGLARVEPPSSDTLIAYAAKAGSLAADGEGANSPFTAALLRNLTTPGLDIRLALGRVHDEVLSNTGRKQEPFVYGALGGSTISLVSLTADSRDDGVAASSPTADVDAPASRDYEFAAKVATKEAWDSFLAKHPAGFYADLAKAQRDKLTGSKPATTDAGDRAKLVRPERPSKKTKSEEKVRTARSYPNCRPDYQASYRQSLEVARSVGHYPAAMIAQYRRQCGPN
jgi:Caspase domain